MENGWILRIFWFWRGRRPILTGADHLKFDMAKKFQPVRIRSVEKGRETAAWRWLPLRGRVAAIGLSLVLLPLSGCSTTGQAKRSVVALDPPETKTRPQWGFNQPPRKQGPTLAGSREPTAWGGATPNNRQKARTIDGLARKVLRAAAQAARG